MWFADFFVRWPPGVPPDPKKCENVFIFDPKTEIFQDKKGGHSVLFFNLFGEKTDDTVPKNRSEVISQLKRASIPF